MKQNKDRMKNLKSSSPVVLPHDLADTHSEVHFDRYPREPFERSENRTDYRRL
jgi:hypothetical protein